ncbi:LecA/PA-IL family lectin [Pseudocitrobacter cyperus]|uniref:LecA/PA-IL family lectin n=1 Tax=Pseudocitrobacter cyperus TaxID=3112843 RepID=A0ABV0HGQ5_9ENTR
MTVSPNWSGKIDAKDANGTPTGLKINAGDKITIIAGGWVYYGREIWAIAFPDARMKDGSKLAKDAVLKARFSTSGKNYDIGRGVYQWVAPESGELILYVHDSSHSDNNGAFEGEVYLTENKTVAVTKKAQWRGHVAATNANWTSTDITVAKGDKIILVASGEAQYDSRGRKFGPDGDSQHPSAQTPDSTFVYSGAIAGQLVIKVGEHLHAIGSGGDPWEVPEDGKIALIFNDTNVATEYANNTGGYDVNIVVLNG